LAVALESIRVLFFDQLLDNLGAGVNDWHSKTVRDALQPLRGIARELDLGVIGCLHPNKRGDSFRDLVSGAVAFNAQSRSSLLVAEHPGDDSRRVVVRGKGNLSAVPSAIEFEITGHRFRHHGHDFDVPLADDFRLGEMTVDDLIEASPVRTGEDSKTTAAAHIIGALLPRDGDWHPGAPIYEACAVEGLDRRTVGRAKQRLNLQHRRRAAFQGAVEWRWPTAEGVSKTSLRAVAGVASVASGATSVGSTQATSDSGDTHDTDDHGDNGVGTAGRPSEDRTPR
jgi:hypothetical protein